MSVIERALKCVVFLGLTDPTGLQFTPYGTGFIFSTFYEEIMFDYIVTCHHVINIIPGDKVCIRLNLKDGGSTSFATSKSSWLFDPIQDIAVLSQEIGELAEACRIIDKDILTKKILKDKWTHGDQIRPPETTILLGLFTSHYGLTHNIPIVRIGNIAAMPDDLIYTDTGYIKAYLIETRSIGGLSGSPVFLSSKFKWLFFGMMRGRFNTRDPNDVVRSEIRDDKELKEIIDQLTPKLKKAFLGLMGKHFLLDDINTGIGIVIPAEVIFDFINQPEFIAQREETVKELKKKTHYRPCVATPKSDNPQHKEDFNSLLTAAAKKKPPADET